MVLFSKTLSAQEFPPIQNYTAIDYAAEHQNWGITQTKDKNIYAANNAGVLEFNGANWKLYGSPNGSAIRSVKAIDDIIYSGCYMEFGFWKKNAFGNLEYRSISSELSSPLLEDEEFWNITELDGFVLFQSLERIYIYDTSNRSISIVAAASKKADLFNYDKTIYYHSTGHGLFKINNGTSVLVSDDPRLKDIAVLGIFSIENKPLLVTQNGKFYFLEEEGLNDWNVEFNTSSHAINIYSTLQLNDGSIILGTISNGIYHISAAGTLKQKINKERGLNNNTVLSVFEDVERNLWLALDNGLSIINMDSPFKEYIDKKGQLGVVYASARYNDMLYLGTNQGLFYKNSNSDGDFTLLEGTEGQVWLLKNINGVLFCGHNNGTYVVEDKIAILISSFSGTWDLKKIPEREDIILQGNYDGLSVICKNNGKWSFRNRIKGFDISSRFVEFIGANELVVNREFKGIFKLDIDIDYTLVTKERKEASKGIGASLVTYLDEVLYTCNNGIFRYNSPEKQFVADTSLTNAFYGDLDNPVGIFIAEEEKDRLWCFTNTNIAFAGPGKFSNQSEIQKIAIPSYVRKDLGILGFESLTPLEDETYLIGISNGYLTLDLNKSVKDEYKVDINSIARKTKSTVFENISINDETDFNYDQNNLYFSYNVAEYNKYVEVYYQYQLKGIYDNWSSWSSTPDVSFENLPYGNYIFNVRAKIGNELSVNTASYKFRINRPWYLSNIMIFLYVSSLMLFIVLVHRFYKRYYKKRQEQILKENKKKLKRKALKTEKKLIQLNNKRLKEEVESKNRELAISTMSIIKKNEFLNTIKNQLKNSSNDPQIKAVIRTIDRNINNVDDWKFFEEAFNNADKNFLKKIKEIHPDLTANDLKLCAYLRLNLSSKEIAPLLNISVRSVEVKRYRLRKKMNLEHERGLVTYILDL